jgi:hypothetical protein
MEDVKAKVKRHPLKSNIKNSKMTTKSKFRSDEELSENETKTIGHENEEKSIK